MCSYNGWRDVTSSADMATSLYLSEIASKSGDRPHKPTRSSTSIPRKLPNIELPQIKHA